MSNEREREREKEAPQTTIKLGQYFMKMKRCGTVYSSPEEGGGGHQISHHVEFFFIQTEAPGEAESERGQTGSHRFLKKVCLPYR